MNTLKLTNGSDLDKTIFEMYLQEPLTSGFTMFIKTLDDNIIDTTYHFNIYGTSDIIITFKDEISKTFFLLKYT